MRLYERWEMEKKIAEHNKKYENEKIYYNILYQGDNIGRFALNKQTLGTVGVNCVLATKGDWIQMICANGRNTLLSRGKRSYLASTGSDSKIATFNDKSRAISCGDHSVVNVSGHGSLGVAVGYDSVAKGSVGTWLTLAEYDYGGINLLCVKSERIDGEKIKANTWYMLDKGEFREAYHKRSEDQFKEDLGDDMLAGFIS